ncbi:5e77a018-5156-4f60-b40b-2159ab023bf8 [Sclerotinia trifoliorum]|uniref:5e77a018-5156-4f60-b40b-2159ab023bf8 n=1 Tax=Sclerotinia trifoliorum TaxID=28548 RepID=A0A8H2W6L2_9HELO|nr:5e77a018-5156-4f60-b40b-2159ab023bf8 [Sclerotinia trifoliorum]
MSGLDVLGAVSAASGLLESAISIIERLHKAYGDMKAFEEVFESRVIEIQGILTIIELVKNESNLRTAAVLSEIENIRKITEKLVEHLESTMPGEKSQARRFAHQIAKGSKDQERLAKLMERLDRAKSNLGLSLHVANVGVTHGVGDDLAINTDILNRVDQLLRNIFGDEGGLRIAELVKNQHPQNDGFVHIKGEDLSRITTSGDDLGGNSKDAGWLSRRITLNNVTREQALQINGPIGEKGWREEVSHLEIRNNEASGSSIQINHAVSEEAFYAMLANRDRNKRIGHNDHNDHNDHIGSRMRISAGLGEGWGIPGVIRGIILWVNILFDFRIIE